MTNVILCVLFLVSLAGVSSLPAYTNLSSNDVHARLVRGDTLILLDVREESEYWNGHIAEPFGQLPLTPANMPWNSNVLSAEYFHLPQNIDILIYCRSGRRSAAASSFLETKGFARIFNMTGRFSSWPFETRAEGFGDHSGQWISPSDPVPAAIASMITTDTSKLVIPAKAFSQIDSLYVELHAASSVSQSPPNVPQTELDGVFQIIVLDRFGLSVFTGDSLALADTISLRFFPHTLPSPNPASLVDPAMSVYTSDQGWKSVPCLVDGFSFNRNETVLRKWYSLQGTLSTAVHGCSRSVNPDIWLFPNPFNGSIQIHAPKGATTRIFDTSGGFVDELHSNQWCPDQTTGSGVYFIQFAYPNHFVTKKAIFIK